MLRLTTFGGLSIAGDRPLGPAASHKKRLAMLAIIAVAGERGISRDKLLLYLWPESDSDKGRRALSQALYALRSDLGSEVVSGTTDLRLNRSVIDSDVGEFRRALAADDPELAATLYAGPFLDGVHLSACPDFERWLDGERQSLSREYEGAVEKLAGRALDERRYTDAVSWWRRLVAHEPTRSVFVLELVRSLIAAGDRAGALRAVSDHQSIMRQELGIEADASFEAAVRKALLAPTEMPRERDTPAPQPAVVPEERTPVAPVRKLPRWIRFAGAVALVGVLAIPLARVARPVPIDHAGRVAIFPFDVNGPVDIREIGAGMNELVGSVFEPRGRVGLVDQRALWAALRQDTAALHDPARAAAIAERFDARFFVLGRVIGAGTKMRVTASVYDRDSSSNLVSTTTAEGDRNDPFTIANTIASDLFGFVLGGRPARFAREAGRMTTSVEALRYYMKGEVQARQGDYPSATESLRRAVAADSGFALAYYRLSIAADWASQSDIAEAAAERAGALSDRLTDHDRLMLTGLGAWRAGNAEIAEAAYRDVVRRYPDDPEAWYQLGEVLYHLNWHQGRPTGEATAAFARAVALEPRDAESLSHLARLAAIRHDSVALDTMVRSAIAAAPARDWWELRAFRTLSIGDSTARSETLRSAGEQDGITLYNLSWRLAIYPHDFGSAMAVASVLTDSSRRIEERSGGYVIRAALALAQGQRRRADADFARAELIWPLWTQAARASFIIAPFFALTPDSLRQTRQAIRSWDFSRETRRGLTIYPWLDEPLRHYLDGLVSSRLGDTVSIVLADRSLASITTDDTAHVAFYRKSLQAYVNLLRGRPTRALETLVTDPRLSWSGTSAYEYDRFLRASILESLGNDADALNWYGTFDEISIPGLIYAAPSHLERGRILERRGERERAVAEFSKAAALWSNCDPELCWLRDEAREAVRRLSAGRGLK